MRLSMYMLCTFTLLKLAVVNNNADRRIGSSSTYKHSNLWTQLNSSKAEQSAKLTDIQVDRQTN